MCGACNRGKSTTEEFIEKAIKIHGNTYDYTKAVYTTIRQDAIIITCKKHGDFKQMPRVHLNGRGCPKCFADRVSILRRNSISLTLDEWTERLLSKFPHILLDTSSIPTPVRFRHKVNFECKLHGTFNTAIGYIMQHTYLCPECARLAAQEASSKHGLYTPTNLYYVYFPQFNKWKLGISIYDTTKRFANVPHELVWSVKGTHQTIARAEYELHKYLKEFQYTGEKLIKDGNTEIYIGNIIPTEEVLYKLLEKLNLKIDGASEW